MISQPVHMRTTQGLEGMENEMLREGRFASFHFQFNIFLILLEQLSARLYPKSEPCQHFFKFMRQSPKITRDVK